MADRYELVITGEAEVIAGPLRRLRELAEERQVKNEVIWPYEVLAILEDHYDRRS